MRNSGLDFLRGIAIILVLFRHGNNQTIIHDIGWGGVDLFFVLSGFLVSGLIFKEFLNNHTVDAKKFLIRRGFKIYPSFYLFIIISIVFNYFHNQNVYSLNQILDEVFYLQSYRPAMWIHTWSLAVEEHFYLTLALITFLCLKITRIQNHQFIKIFLIAGLCLTFLMRLFVCYRHKDEPFFAFSETHLRMDGILIGVFISYLYYFTDFYKLFLKFKYALLGLAAVLISPLFIFPAGSFYMNTLGLSTMNVGFGILVLFSLGSFTINQIIIARIAKIPFVIICFIGIHSYSIYLWHLLCYEMAKVINGNQDSFLLQMVMALSIGIFLSFFIEKSFLEMRDQFYNKNKSLSNKPL